MKNKMIQYGCQGLFSKDMESYLAKEISERKAVEIITGAPIPLAEKKERLKKILTCTKDIEIKDDVESCISHIDEALYELTNMSDDSFILAESCWYDIEDGSSLDCVHRSGSESFNLPFVSFDELIQGILDEIEGETNVRDFAADKRTWHEFVIWNKTNWSNGRIKFEEGTYKYVMIGPDVCYIESGNWTCQRDYRGFLSGSSNLNLSVPFKSGDIVTLDCRPFADPGHLLILNAEDNWDCCGLRGAFADENGKLHIDAVKHGHCFPNHYISRLSPLYRMSLSSGPLLEHEMVIKQIHSDMKTYTEEERDIYGRIFENIATHCAMFDKGYLKSEVEVCSIFRGI